MGRQYNFYKVGREHNYKVARPAKLPHIKYHSSSKDFIDFESRKSKFMELVEALEGGNHYMIGLQGMGGTGKTTLATQVGKQVEESKAFEKVIFVVVSNPPDVNKIRGDIARHLGLPLEEMEEADHSRLLWSRIYNNKKKLLIILDDVWEALNLTGIGIPYGLDHNNCYVLITTRHPKVCQEMRCQQIVRLDTLDNEDALRLFHLHATNDADVSSRNELEGLAQDFLKECGGLPVAIVGLASTLRNWHFGELNEAFTALQNSAALTALQNSKSLVDVDEDLVEVYSCLRLSYDNLHNEKAKHLFLLCSIFPEDYEFPINLIIALGIGSGIFEEVDDYCAARMQALAVKNKLIDSSLLQKVGEKECVKMHDLVREVAQWIGKEDIQVIKDSRTTLKTNKRFVFWSTNDFPDQSDDTKLEILLLWITGNVLVKDPYAFFARMSRLRILFLLGEYDRKVPFLSLPMSLLSLKYIQTIILDGWELGDISSLKNIQSLVTLELKNCLIIELPKNISELKKLRWLGMRNCEIQNNNPFEVIEKCSQLEEVYFVENFIVKDWNTEDDKETEGEIAQDISPTEFQIFSIAYHGFKRFSSDDNGLLRCFNPEHTIHLIPDAMFKYLVRSAEVLELGKIGQTTWKNLAPDIIPLDNLIKLYLYEWDDIECLIDNSKYHYSNTTFFSKLVELHLYRVDVKELFWGAMPPRFLWQLQILKLEKCMKLQNIFFDETIKLPHLKVLRLIRCPMLRPSIFQPSVAQSLERLEELVVEGCKELKSLIAYESFEQEIIVVGSLKNYGLLFPKLKSLLIKGCGKLKMLFSLLLPGDLPKLKDLHIDECEELKYIFGEYRVVGQVLQQEIILPLLIEVLLCRVPSFIKIFQNSKKYVLKPPQVFKEDSKEKRENSKIGVCTWAYGCCFKAPTKDTNIVVPNATMEVHTISQGSRASSNKRKIGTFHTTECLMRQPLSLQNIRDMSLSGCSKLKSLFSGYIATSIMLETLIIIDCGELKDIITNEAEGDNLNCTSIFPKLESLQVNNCNKLEFIFPSTISGGLQKLKSIDIFEAQELKYVFGKYNEEKCVSNENENNEPHIHLPALETLSLWYVPNMISIGVKKYPHKCPSLQIVEAPEEIKKYLQDVTSERAKESELQEIVNVERPLTPTVGFQYFVNFHDLKEIEICRNIKLKTLFSVSACRNLPQLSKLTIEECEELVYVVEDDSHDHHHMNYSSIFPKLEDLSILYCNKLQFIFPLSLFGSLQKLKSLSIKESAELKYIFWNENDQLQIHLPALEALSLLEVPKMINICAKKYYLSFPSLQSIALGDLLGFNGRSFLDSMAYLQEIQLNEKVPKDLKKIIKDVQKLTELRIGDSKIEEVFNLEGMEIEGKELPLSLEEMWLNDLSELNHICKGPKYILSLPNLRQLGIIACKKLRVIFNVSIVKSLPQLSYLIIKDCDELVDIIEESVEGHLHQICFPKLEELSIDCCNSLKYLFSISTCGMFPKLCFLEIEEASELEQVFIHKQDDMQMTTMMDDVFPMLSRVTLRKLPMLITICEGIDYQNVGWWSRVNDCPKYQGINDIQEGPEDGDSENQVGTNALLDFAESSKDAMKTNVEEVVTSMIPELEDERKTIESTTQFQQEDLVETKATNEVSHKINTPLGDYSVDVILKERYEQGSTLEDVAVADLKPRNSSNVTSSSVSQVGGLQSDPSTMAYKEIEKEVGKAIPGSILVATTSPDFEVASMKEKHEQGSQGDDATRKDEIALQSTHFESMKQTKVSYIIAQSLEEIEKEAVKGHASQLPIPPTSINLKVALDIKDTMEQGLKETYEEDDAMMSVRSTNSNSKKQSTITPVDNLSRKDFAMEKEKGVHENAIAIDTLPRTTPFVSEFVRPLTVEEAGDHPSVQKEARLEEPLKAILPQVIPSLRYQLQYADAGSTSPKLGICEIFQLVELKHGEMALFAQAVEQYPQLLLPRANRTNRIIALSYRVLVDILVMLDTKTPNTITQPEKSTLEANLSDAIFLGFDKDWVESVRAKVLRVDMLDVSIAKEKIQAMELKLREIDSQLSGLSEYCKELIVNMNMFRDIVNTKKKPYGI